MASKTSSVAPVPPLRACLPSPHPLSLLLSWEQPDCSCAGLLSVATPLQGAAGPLPQSQATPLPHPDLCPWVVSPEKLPLSPSWRLPILLLAFLSSYHVWLFETTPACVSWLEVCLPLSNAAPRRHGHFLSHLPSFPATGSTLCTSEGLSRSLLNEQGYGPELRTQTSNIQAEQAMAKQVRGNRLRVEMHGGLQGYTLERRKGREHTLTALKGAHRLPQEPMHAQAVHPRARTVPTDAQMVITRAQTVPTRAQQGTCVHRQYRGICKGK